MNCQMPGQGHRVKNCALSPSCKETGECEHKRLREEMRMQGQDVRSFRPGEVIIVPPGASVKDAAAAAQVVEGTRVFASGATRDADDSKLDYEGFLSPFALERFAMYMHEARLRNPPPGQKLRDSDNWQKGIPKHAYLKSLLRHVFALWRHWRATGHVSQIDACGVMFNVQGLLHEDLKERGVVSE
jgi:hypothetical protein